jgi:hypothetical protein
MVSCKYEVWCGGPACRLRNEGQNMWLRMLGHEMLQLKANTEDCEAFSRLGHGIAAVDTPYEEYSIIAYDIVQHS